MVAALTAAELREANSVWLPDFIEYVDGWEKRTNGSTWRDVTGYLIHHTGDNAPDGISLNVLVHGHGSLPGPLCTEGIGDDGTVYQVSIGPANHAGGGDPDVLAAVRAESYGSYPPKTNEHHGSAGSVSGNPVFYGGETMYGNDAEPKPHPIQYRSMVVVAASRIWALDKKDKANTWTAKSAIGHKEWSDWKPDPRGVDMAEFRVDVQWCLDAGPVAARAWHKTGNKEEDPLAQFDTPEKLLKAIVQTDGVLRAPLGGDPRPGQEANEFWWLETYIRLGFQMQQQQLALTRTLAESQGGELISVERQEEIFREIVQAAVDERGAQVNPKEATA